MSGATPSAHVAGLTKRRQATKSEVRDRREQLFPIIQLMRPMTVRQVLCQASADGIVNKSEAG